MKQGPDRGRGAIPCDSSSAVELCDKAKRILRDSLDMHPDDLQREIDEAENAIVKLRDCLIELLRDDTLVMSVEQSRWREPLDHVNVALSLITGVEYPSAGIHRVRIEEARDTIEIVRGWLSG